MSSKDSANLPGSSAQHPWRALSVTLAVQTSTSFAQSVPAILAPVIALQLDVGAHQIGNFTGMLYVVAMLSGLMLSPTIEDRGALRVSQWAALGCAAGLLAVATGHLVIVIFGAWLLGFGYGLANPTAASILGRHAPQRRRGLLFSIKQTGVPLGVAIGGILVPQLLDWWSWRGALFCAAAICATCALAIQPWRSLFDHNLSKQRTEPVNALAPLRHVMADATLRQLSLVSLSFAATQVCFLVFVVTYLTSQRSLSLAVAASLLASAQLVSICARPFWGWLGDRFGGQSKLLGGLGVGMAAACVLLAYGARDAGALSLVCVALCGLTAVAWNGVFFAELARRSPVQQLASNTGGVQFMTFTGAMLGPVVFGASVAAGLDYSMSYALLAILPLVAGVTLLWREVQAG